jgi:hypothetical protein
MKSRLFWALKWQRAKRLPFGPKIVEKTHFQAFGKKFRKLWIKLLFFSKFPVHWVLRVSEMGSYAQKMRKTAKIIAP